jgi:hypothetical protein
MSQKNAKPTLRSRQRKPIQTSSSTLAREDYLALRKDFEGELANLGDWKGNPQKEREFNELVQKFIWKKQEILSHYEQWSTVFPDPPEIETWLPPVVLVQTASKDTSSGPVTLPPGTQDGVDIETEKVVETTDAYLKRVPQHSNNPLTFEPGTIIYRGCRQELAGKPLEIVKALHKARHHTLSKEDLRWEVWREVIVSDETMRRQIFVARKALRKVIRSAKVKSPSDPIPTVDRGPNRTAWRLKLP